MACHWQSQNRTAWVQKTVIILMTLMYKSLPRKVDHIFKVAEWAFMPSGAYQRAPAHVCTRGRDLSMLREL